MMALLLCCMLGAEPVSLPPEPVLSERAPGWVAEVFDAALPVWREHMAKLVAERSEKADRLTAMRAGRINIHIPEPMVERRGTIYFKSRQDRDQIIREAEARLAELDRWIADPGRHWMRGFRTIPEDLGFRGEIGRLSKVVHIRDVIDGGTMLVGLPSTRVVRHELGPGRVHHEVIEEFVPLWVVGVSTEGRVSGDRVQISGVFDCTGTETYGTVAGGQQTVIKLVKLDGISEWLVWP